ncbi:YdcF family protein [Oscillatoria sp. FACHB-1407]|uniref:YdcF family protein n=1 Tax=Oscillatoria sp. FACHB-1407 TaxID=2692847 RepID=UPI001687225C|nr:YdcF family protein [Oscillatoria sp. FACHB-1407]MBD2459658.1 YdcF family protein [Oscillatoria sp. FACHB-1407]
MPKRQLLPKLGFILVSISLILLVILLVLSGSIAINLAIAQSEFPHPQAILTLGGSPDREEFAAELAKNNPTLPVWVSTGSTRDKAQAIFEEAGIPLDRVNLDYRAVDTVTNFTSLVHDFQTQGIRHVYLITSDFHMRRARAIAFFVFGSRGIFTTPIAMSSKQPPETLLHVSRDIGRSLLWIATGRTGASFNPKLHNKVGMTHSDQKLHSS